MFGGNFDHFGDFIVIYVILMFYRVLVILDVSRVFRTLYRVFGEIWSSFIILGISWYFGYFKDTFVSFRNSVLLKEEQGWL